MRVVFKLPVKEGIVIFVSDKDSEFLFDDMNVEWEIDEKNHLASVKLLIVGQVLQVNDRGFIKDSFPELEERAFQVASYIANRIFIQTGVEALDPKFVFYGYVDVFPETSDEEKVFATHDTAFDCCFPVTWNIVSPAFQPPEDFTAGFKLFKAFANYADGLRVSSPFLRYEQFYKVVECFFPDKEIKDFIDRVYKYVLSHDGSFEKNQIRELRETRNRLIHPKADLGHLNPSERASVRKVEAALPLLHSLAKILLQNPPGGNDEKT